MSSSKKSTAYGTKTRVAVFFGGRSPEHDVSVVTGLQVLKAIDQSKFDAFPVYITPDGKWLTGDVLRHRENYLLDANNLKLATEVSIDVSAATPTLLPKKTGLFGGKPIEFDIAIPSFHGLTGEDGNMQGVFETCCIPYAGMRTMASSLLMDKVATKYVLQALQIPTLPFAVLKRPNSGYLIPKEEIRQTMGNIGFPCIVKPSHLGSSIGVAKAKDLEEVSACLPAIFAYDGTAIVEPFVENLVEYNVAVGKFSGETRTSAIERPKSTDELLDFKQKYLAGGGGKKGGTKTPGQSSQGMLSLTRELNPSLPQATETNIRNWSKLLFDSIEGTGAPRIDYIGNSKTGEVWMNEVNPWPGSIGYFLWEAAEDSVLFTELMTALIDEAREVAKSKKLPRDPVPVDARLLKRPT